MKLFMPARCTVYVAWQVLFDRLLVSFILLYSCAASHLRVSCKIDASQ